MGTLAYKQVCALCITAVWGLALLAGCGGPKTMPKDWPIPGLTLPPKSTILQVTTRPATRGGLSSASTWMVNFKCALHPQQVIEDVEGKLRQLRYLRAAERLEPSPDARLYLALDKHTQVLLYTKLPSAAYGRYSITITIYKEITDLSHDATSF